MTEGNGSAQDLSIIVVDAGNTTVAIGRWEDGNVFDVIHEPVADREATTEALETVRQKCANQQRQAIVIASVVPDVTEHLRTYIEQTLNLRPFVVGENTPLPIEVNLNEQDSVGVDRVCTAAAAFLRTEHACTVVDVGTAVTIDVIDDDGVFQGGAILPGLRMQAQSLAEQTASLPRVEVSQPASVVGKDTQQAICSGLWYGLAGAIRDVVEQIATEGSRWPQVVLTGGGAQELMGRLDFVDSVVPDLCLIGIGWAYVKRVQEESCG